MEKFDNWYLFGALIVLIYAIAASRVPKFLNRGRLSVPAEMIINSLQFLSFLGGIACFVQAGATWNGAEFVTHQTVAILFLACGILCFLIFTSITIGTKILEGQIAIKGILLVTSPKEKIAPLFEGFSKIDISPESQPSQEFPEKVAMVSKKEE